MDHRRTYVVDPKVFPCVEDYLKSREVSSIVLWNEVVGKHMEHHIVFVQQPPPLSILKQIPCKLHRISLLNIEQLSRVTARRWLYSSLTKCAEITELIDYTESNTCLFQDFLRRIYRNIEITIEPFAFIPAPFPNSTRHHRVAFVGAMSSRRKRILDELSDVDVVYIQLWGKERDSLISQCSVLLNIHYGDDYTIFESFRCGPWVNHPHLHIVSEVSFGQRDEWMFPYVVWEEYDRLASTVRKLINTPKLNHHME